MIDFELPREVMATFRFTALVTLFFAFFALGSHEVRRAWRGEQMARQDWFIVALCLELGGACGHQGFWWMVEQLRVWGNCGFGAHIDLNSNSYCIAAKFLRRLDFVTLFFYTAWIGGAAIIIGFWLAGVFNDMKPRIVAACMAGFVLITATTGYLISSIEPPLEQAMVRNE